MTITVRLPDEIEAKLRTKLGMQQIDPEDIELLEFVRQAISEKLEREPVEAKPSAYESYLAVYKGWSSGESDRAERSEEILRDTFDAERRKHA